MPAGDGIGRGATPGSLTAALAAIDALAADALRELARFVATLDIP